MQSLHCSPGGRWPGRASSGVLEPRAKSASDFGLKNTPHSTLLCSSSILYSIYIPLGTAVGTMYVHRIFATCSSIKSPKWVESCSPSGYPSPI
jgi:hypothetical protein